MSSHFSTLSHNSPYSTLSLSLSLFHHSNLNYHGSPPLQPPRSAAPRSSKDYILSNPKSGGEVVLDSQQDSRRGAYPLDTHRHNAQNTKTTPINLIPSSHVDTRGPDLQRSQSSNPPILFFLLLSARIGRPRNSIADTAQCLRGGCLQCVLAMRACNACLPCRERWACGVWNIIFFCCFCLRFFCRCCSDTRSFPRVRSFVDVADASALLTKSINGLLAPLTLYSYVFWFPLTHHSLTFFWIPHTLCPYVFWHCFALPHSLRSLAPLPLYSLRLPPHSLLLAANLSSESTEVCFPSSILSEYSITLCIPYVFWLSFHYPYMLPTSFWLPIEPFITLRLLPILCLFSERLSSGITRGSSSFLLNAYLGFHYPSIPYVFWPLLTLYSLRLLPIHLLFSEPFRANQRGSLPPPQSYRLPLPFFIPYGLWLPLPPSIPCVFLASITL
ncbi:hypothetical protein C7M84_022152 [Penaeus vannamei]|uniref:Uncharacterized protein n=1 Tax=Penaeus vannamei TaxID=6689 RepID=A0A3R7NE03_PENVA|nr:hypothetical protein C7M84_022152 [Penaeus vannamei]